MGIVSVRNIILVEDTLVKDYFRELQLLINRGKPLWKERLKKRRPEIKQLHKTLWVFN